LVWDGEVVGGGLGGVVGGGLGGFGGILMMVMCPLHESGFAWL